MKCEICGKREATIIYEIKRGKGKGLVLKLCQKCAEEGLEEKLLDSLTQFLPLLVEEDKVCKGCGLKFSQFRDKGLLGCPLCYTTFRSLLSRLLLKLHGSTRHRGRLPRHLEIRKKREELKRKLKIALGAEDYERAAEIKNELERLRC